MIPRFAIPFLALAALAAPALAQQPQPGQPGQPPRPPQPQPQPQREYRVAPGQPHGQGDGPQFRDFNIDVPQQLRVVHGYLGLVNQFNDLAQDPAASGIAAVLGANEILKPRGADAVIEYFTKLLPEVKNEAVQRAIRIQLVEAYKNSNQHDKALNELQTLITATPAKTE
jgi:hypothetical protein